MLVRCTARLLKLLGPTAALEHAAACEDDWYANLLWLDRRECLLLLHAGTLFPIFAADLRKPRLRPSRPPSGRGRSASVMWDAQPRR